MQYYCNKDKDVQTFIDQAFKSIAENSSVTPDFLFSNLENSTDATVSTLENISMVPLVISCTDYLKIDPRPM